MKLTLDAQVQLNAQRIEKIKNDIDQIKNNHLAHMADDIDELKADVKELNSNVVKILTILAEK